MSSLRTEQVVDVTMPQMGVSVAEGTIVAWRVGVGEPIEADATICDISTDKIDTEVPSPVSGVVTEILVAVDETVEVGTVLARIASGDAATLVAEPAPGPPRAATPRPHRPVRPRRPVRRRRRPSPRRRTRRASQRLVRAGT